MVASIRALASSSQGISYYERDGYYARDDPEHKAASTWVGKGAADLGLQARWIPACSSRFRQRLRGCRHTPPALRVAPVGALAQPPRQGMTSQLARAQGLGQPRQRGGIEMASSDLPARSRQERKSKYNSKILKGAAARQQHPAVESAINHREHRGLDRVRTPGAEGFARTGAGSMRAFNLHRLGGLLRRRMREAER